MGLVLIAGCSSGALEGLGWSEAEAATTEAFVDAWNAEEMGAILAPYEASEAPRDSASPRPTDGATRRPLA